MQRPPPISDASKFPITALLCGGAIAVSLWSMKDPTIVDRLALHGDMPLEQAWRLVTTTLPHGSPAHLIFNLYWTWTLGASLERAFGHGRYLAFVLLAAVISSGAEWSLLSGGIGLSGVVYALCGVLWALRTKPKYTGIVDRKTFNLFIVWFFICIVLTYTGMMPVGNIAHGMGLIVGLVVGEAIKNVRGRRAAWVGLTALMLVGVGAGWMHREHVNLVNIGLRDTRASIELATRAIRDGRTDDAIKHMEQALKDRPEIAQWWLVLAGEYHQAGRMEDALRAARESVRLDPSDADAQDYLRSLEQPQDPASPAEGASDAGQGDVSPDPG